MLEYDPDKSAANMAKHGIDFEQAQELWLDEARAEVESEGGAEVRWLLMGKIEGRHWTAVYTMRDGKVRIISVRRSRANEVRDYGSRQDN